MRFIDSCRFMLSSLDTLAKNLKTDQFKARKACFKERNELMTRKGVCPDNMKETQLPLADQFYNRLNNEHISDIDYAYTQHVFTTFCCQTLEDYHDMYLKGGRGAIGRYL